MYPILESIRIINGRAQNLEWHQERMEISCRELYGAGTPLKLKDVVRPGTGTVPGEQKLRLLYNRDSYTMEYSDYKPSGIKDLLIVDEPGLDYHLKYSDRSGIDRLTATKGSYDDILICRDGMLGDCSYTNIILYDGSKWFTPSTPLLRGTCRERLLHEGRIYERELSTGDLKYFRSFKCINAMRDMDEQEAMDISHIWLPGHNKKGLP